jgi:hypothetical protein
MHPSSFFCICKDDNTIEDLEDLLKESRPREQSLMSNTAPPDRAKQGKIFDSSMTFKEYCDFLYKRNDIIFNVFLFTPIDLIIPTKNFQET